MDKQLAFSVTADDCEWQYMRVGGKGGQKVNKTSSGVRVIHHPSGARAESRDGRSQLQNRKVAFKKMVESVAFKVWMNAKLYEGPTPEERVEKDMDPKNLLVEGREEGTWTPIS
jgi:protein subunit release factor B